MRSPRRPLGSSLLSWLFRRQGSSQRRAARPTARPSLETLEDRLAPAVFRLNTTDDTVAVDLHTGADAQGNVSLRSAIMAANFRFANSFDQESTIVLADGFTYPLTLPGADEDDAASGDLDIRSNLTLVSESNDPSRVIVDADELDRVFQVFAGHSVTISGIGIYNGRSPEGGGIHNSGSLNLSNVHLFFNEAVGSPGIDALGGSVFNAASGVLIINDGSQLSSVANGSAGVDGMAGEDGNGPGQGGRTGTVGSDGGPARGGVIYNDGGSVAILGQSVLEGYAIGGRGGVGGDGGHGYTSSLVDTVSPGPGGWGAGGGNGGMALGGAIYNAGGSVTISVSTVTGEARGGDGGSGGAGGQGGFGTNLGTVGGPGGQGGIAGTGGRAAGGAIYNVGNTTLTITGDVELVRGGTTILGYAYGGYGGQGGSGGHGGHSGVNVNGFGGLGGNGKAGAVSGDAEGGGVFNTSGTVTVTSAFLSGISAAGYGGGGGDGGWGGDGTVNSPFAGFGGAPGDGGAGAAAGRSAGGALFNQTGAIRLTRTELTGEAGFLQAGFSAGGPGGDGGTAGNAVNGAAYNGGLPGAGGAGTTASGGAIYTAGGLVVLDAVSVHDSTASGGTGSSGGKAGDGGTGNIQFGLSAPPTFGGDGGEARGGALAILAGAVTLTNSVFFSNSAVGGSGGVGGAGGYDGLYGIGRMGGSGGDGGSAFGGALDLVDGSLTIVNSSFTNAGFNDNAVFGPNLALGGDGGVGGVGASPQSFFPGDGGSGGAGGHGLGGALHVSAGTVSLTNVTLFGNEARRGDGADGGVGGAFGDTAGEDGPGGADGVGRGGAIAVSGGVVRVLNSILARNAAQPEGPNGFGLFVSLGHNLVDDGAGAIGFADGVNSDQVGDALNRINPLLAPLNHYGGPTRTMTPLPGSPVIGAGVATGAPTTDQRGVARPTFGSVDIGAVESRGFLLTLGEGSDNQAALLQQPFANPLAVIVASDHLEPLEGSEFFDPVEGGVVTFVIEPGANGQAAMVSSGMVTVSSEGIARVTATANNLLGSFTVTAFANGAAPVSFNLTNNLYNLAIVQAPHSIAAGAGFTVVVAARDAQGEVATNFNGTVHLTLADGPGVLGGTLQATATNGIVTFTDLTLDTLGTCLLQARGDNLTAATTDAIAVTAGLLVIDEAPTHHLSLGEEFALTVAARDLVGNTDPNYAGDVFVSVVSGPGNLGGVVQLTLNSVGAFDDLSLDAFGTYTLQVSAAGLLVGTTTVTVAASDLFVTAQPAAVGVGAAFGFSLAAVDAFGNIDPTFQGNATVALPSGSGATLSGTVSASMSNGVADFAGLTLDTVGFFFLEVTTTDAGGAPFAETFVLVPVLPGNQATTVESAQSQFVLPGNHEAPLASASSSANGSSVQAGLALEEPAETPVSVWVASYEGDPTNTVAPDGTFTYATENGPGQAVAAALYDTNVAGISASTAGHLEASYTYYLPVSELNTAQLLYFAPTGWAAVDASVVRSISLASPFPGMGTVNFQATFGPSTSPAIAQLTGTVFAGAAIQATQLTATTQPPARVRAGEEFSITVAAQDPLGNVDTSFTGSVTLTLANNPTGATLGGTLTGNAVAGVVTFADLTLDRIGTAYTLQASSESLTAATTNAIQVTADRFMVVAAPQGSVTAGATFGVVIRAVDGFGTVDASFTGAVGLSLATNPGGAILGGILTRGAVNGEAVFSALTLSQPGAGYSLQATSAGLTATSTSPFNVTPVEVATRLLVTTAPPAAVVAGSGIRVVLKAVDDFGIVDRRFTGSVTIGLGSNPDSDTLRGKVTIQATRGTVTFTNLKLRLAAEGYTFAAQTTALPTVTTAAFAVRAAAAVRLVVTLPPPATSRVNEAFVVTVAAVDRFGNVATGFNKNVAITLKANPGQGTLGGTRTVRASNGVVAFADLTLNRAGVGYRLKAKSGLLTAVVTDPFTVEDV